MFLDDTACNLASLNLLRSGARTKKIRHRVLRARRAVCGRSCSKSRC
ncbi:hypothetical protein [Methylocystis parvus]